MPRRNGGGNIYREVNSLEDVRRINRRIRQEMQGVSQRQQLTELKKRADYLCALAKAPSWKTKFGRKSVRVLQVAEEEDRRTTARANSIAERHGWRADYDPWGG